MGRLLVHDIVTAIIGNTPLKSPAWLYPPNPNVEESVMALVETRDADGDSVVVELNGFEMVRPWNLTAWRSWENSQPREMFGRLLVSLSTPERERARV